MANCPIDGRIQVNNEMRSTGRFTNALTNYTPIDPTEVYVQVTKPNQTSRTYQYGVDIEVRKSSTGVYYIEIVLDQPGEWLFRWYSLGTVVCNTEVPLKVLSIASP